MTADEYLRSVEFWLRDLPWRTHHEVLSEIAGQLAELPPGTDFQARLGTPERYAADLRSAAGLERRRGLLAFLRARRPRNLILTVVALTAIGLTIGAVVWIDSYQPLAIGFGSRYPADAVEAPTGNSASVVFHEGRPFSFGITVHNAGRFTVRVLGVPYPQNRPFKARLLMSPSMDYLRSGMQGPYSRFHPFDLKPGQVRLLFFRGVYANCGFMSAGGVMSLDDFPVRFSFLWRTTTAEIPLPEELAIVFKKDVSCPPTTR